MTGDDMGAMPAVPDKRDWPRTEHGTIDWEAAFEAPEKGLIHFVDQTATSNGVLACGKVIVHALFNRQDDGDMRAEYERRLNDAMTLSVDDDTGAADEGLDQRRARVIDLLRDIKAERIERAAFHVARINMSAEDEISERRLDEAPEPAKPSEPTEPAPDTDIDLSSEDAFVQALSELLVERLRVLRHDVAPGKICDAVPPYPVAPAFAERFEALVRERFAPAMMAACRPFILQAEHQQPAERVAFIRQHMEERRSREILWESWRIVWKEMTEEQDLPKKPKEEKKGLFNKLKKKKQQPSWMGEAMTMEEWEDEVARIERANLKAIETWALLTAPHGEFLPPEEGDRKTLMNLFARTPGAISKQIKAIRQIAEQGGNPGKVFADYQQGKDIDLPLLCAVCQAPDIFLKKPLLKDFMRSFPDSMKRDRFRLTCRSFPDFT